MKTVSPLYHYISRKTKLFTNIYEIEKRCRLLCLSYDVLGSKLIGLDTFRRKLLYVELNKNRLSFVEIYLTCLETCTIKKEYKSINVGGLKRKKLHEYLKTISLELHFKNGFKAIGIPFYEEKKDKMRMIQDLEAKAKTWQSTVLKLLPLSVKKEASAEISPNRLFLKALD